MYAPFKGFCVVLSVHAHRSVYTAAARVISRNFQLGTMLWGGGVHLRQEQIYTHPGAQTPRVVDRPPTLRVGRSSNVT